MPEAEDFASVAHLLLEGRTYALGISAQHQRLYGVSDTAAAKVHNLRSSVIAGVGAGRTPFDLELKHTAQGRVCLIYPASGAPFLLKSENAIPFVSRLFVDVNHYDASPEITFLLRFGFHGPDVELATAPARRLLGTVRQSYKLLDSFEFLGRWGPSDPSPFDQGDGAGDEWWHGFDDGEDDVGFGS